MGVGEKKKLGMTVNDFGVSSLVISALKLWWWLHNSVNILRTIGYFHWVSRVCELYISVKLFKKLNALWMCVL